jgi:hypothetical protein
MWRLLPALIVFCAMMIGCIGKKPANPAATQPVTLVPAERAEPEYWLRQPPTAEVKAPSFDALWRSSEAAAKKCLFEIDLRDYRRGQLVTKPMTSRQWFEVWRKDTKGVGNLAENSLGTLRRTVYFEFTKNLDGTFTVAPKVVVERMSRADPKYAGQIEEARVYWYALRRDPGLEERLAESIRQRMRG